MSLCHEHHWRGNFLWPSIPNQRLKIIVLARLVVVVDIRTGREITIWIMSRQSPRWIHWHLKCNPFEAYQPANFEQGASPLG